jgi:hypothetical protein
MGTSNDNTRYYSDDISLLPPRAIWRLLRRHPHWIQRLPLFIYFIGCKIAGSKNPVYGLPRPAALVEVEWSSLPAEAQQACEATASACREAGFHPVTYLHSQAIGSRRGYSAVWLHSQGQMYATSIWFEIRRAGQLRSKAVFGCHSVRTNAQILNCGSIAPNDWIPELIPPNHNILNIWPEASPVKIIESHRNRIRCEFDLQQLNEDTVRQQVLVSSQQLFDYVITKGICAPLTQSEIERIRRNSI